MGPYREAVGGDVGGGHKTAGHLDCGPRGRPSRIQYMIQALNKSLRAKSPADPGVMRELETNSVFVKLES